MRRREREREKTACMSISINESILYRMGRKCGAEIARERGTDFQGCQERSYIHTCIYTCEVVAA